MIDLLVQWVQPLFQLLESWIGDWGITVIIFTALVRVLLIPISINQSNHAVHQYMFSKKVAELQKSWKGSPEALFAEKAKLMQKYRFKPWAMMGTALIQAPIFMVLVATFAHLGPTAPSIIVPWVASIGLSDPWMVVPIVIAIFNGLASWVTLIPPELTQVNPKLIFAFTAGISLFILWSAPVATALYFATSSLWGAMERRLLRFRVRRKISEYMNMDVSS